MGDIPWEDLAQIMGEQQRATRALESIAKSLAIIALNLASEHDDVEVFNAAYARFKEVRNG